MRRRSLRDAVRAKWAMLLVSCLALGLAGCSDAESAAGDAAAEDSGSADGGHGGSADGGAADGGRSDGGAADARAADGGDAGKARGWRGFSKDQTHVDTSWLLDADENGELAVEKVTNLDADGEGSLAAALGAAEGNDNTLIVFEVGGVIDNGGTTYIRSRADNVYIAGQTAPYPGVTVVRGGLRIHGSNTIVEHVTFLPGDDISEPHKARAITYNAGVSNVLVNHCTAAWAPDTNVDVHDDASNVAFINSINAEALNDSSHPEAPHGYGILVKDGTTGLALLGNLQAHNWKRNLKPNSARIVFANNYIYNWGARVQHGGDPAGEIDWIGNVVEAGDDTDLSSGVFDDDDTIVYWDDNELIPPETPLNDGDIEYVDSPLNLPEGLSRDDFLAAEDLESFLVSSVGPRPADRAPHEQRIIDDLVDREGRIIDHHDDVGGYPSYDSNTRPLDPPSTGLLEWLQRYTGEVELGE